METFEFFLVGMGDGLVPNGGVIRGAKLNHVPDDACQFMGHGGDGFWGAEAGFPAAEAIAKIVLAVPEALGGEAQGSGRAAIDVTGFDGKDPAAGDAVVGTGAEPGGETLGGGKAGGEIRSEFGIEHEGGADLDAGDLGEINAVKAIEFGTGIKFGFVALGFLITPARGGQGMLG